MGTIVNLSIVKTQNSLPSSMMTMEKETGAMLENEMDWYTLFKMHITEAIDEKPFRKMFRKYNHLNAPVRVLAAMAVLKHSFGWTEKQIFESNNDIKLRFALGVRQAFDTPSVYVYKAFEEMLEKYQAETGIDLVQVTIQKLAKNRGPVFKTGSKRLMLWATQVA